MKFLPGGGVASASGSEGGRTYSRNRFGPYIRTKAIPVNPGTIFQQAVRTFLATLTSQWVDTLTQSDRDLWEAYAQNVPVTDALGQSITLTGLNMYVRSNVPRLQAGLGALATAPGIFDLGSFTAPSIALDTTNQEVDVTFTDADPWANETGGAMLIYVSRAQSPSVNFFKGPYRFAEAILGNAITAPTSPQAVTAPFAFLAGQLIYVQVRVTREDGRLSSTFRTFAVAP